MFVFAGVVYQGMTNDYASPKAKLPKVSEHTNHAAWNSDSSGDESKGGKKDVTYEAAGLPSGSSFDDDYSSPSFSSTLKSAIYEYIPATPIQSPFVNANEPGYETDVFPLGASQQIPRSTSYIYNNEQDEEGDDVRGIAKAGAGWEDTKRNEGPTALLSGSLHPASNHYTPEKQMMLHKQNSSKAAKYAVVNKKTSLTGKSDGRTLGSNLPFARAMPDENAYMKPVEEDVHVYGDLDTAHTPDGMTEQGDTFYEYIGADRESIWQMDVRARSGSKERKGQPRRSTADSIGMRKLARKEGSSGKLLGSQPLLHNLKSTNTAVYERPGGNSFGFRATEAESSYEDLPGVSRSSSGQTQNFYLLGDSRNDIYEQLKDPSADTLTEEASKRTSSLSQVHLWRPGSRGESLVESQYANKPSGEDAIESDGAALTKLSKECVC